MMDTEKRIDICAMDGLAVILYFHIPFRCFSNDHFALYDYYGLFSSLHRVIHHRHHRTVTTPQQKLTAVENNWNFWFQ